MNADAAEPVALARAERLALSRAVLAALKGAAPEPLPTAPRPALEEQADAGDPTAQRTLALLRRLDDVPRRVRRTLAIEGLEVVVADGSKLPLDEAERVLANKEDRRVHAALRRSIDEALAPFRQFHRYGSDTVTRAAAKPFLVDTAALRDAAREALGSLGGAPLEDALSLAWALDLPDAQGAFGDDATRALVTALRDAVRTPPAAFRAPRAMAGAALDGRYAWPSGLRRADRHVRTLEAAGTAAAWAHGAGAVVGMAAALALSSAPIRQAAGMDRRSAERAARICAATVVLRARAGIAIAALAEDAHEDEAREALIDALGIDPGRALLVQLAAPSWASVDDETPCTLLHAPAYALALRDAFDETWVLRVETWDAIEHGDVVRSIADNNSDAKASDVKRSDAKASDVRPSDVRPSDVRPSDAKPSAIKPSAIKPSVWATSWRTWAGEWL